MTYVLFIALLNFVLGIGLAFLLFRRRGHASVAFTVSVPPVTVQAAPERRRRAKDTKSERPRKPHEASGETSVLKEAVRLDPISVPADWRTWLGSDEPFHDWVDAATATCHRIVLETLQSLIPIDETLKRAEQSGGDAGFVRVEQDLQQLVKGLRQRLLSIRQNLAAHAEGDSSPVRQVLADALQGMQQGLDEVSPPEGTSVRVGVTGETLQKNLLSLARALHALRDELFTVATQRLVLAGKACDLVSRMREDKVVECETRVGFELVLSTWLESDPARARSLTFVLFDIDRTEQLNREMGLDAGDRHVSEVLKLLARCIRQNRGFDRVFRVGGQQLLLFLGDTHPKNAAYAAERIRQTLAQAHFRWRNRVTDVRCSAALTPLHRDDTVERILDRLVRTIRKAKRAGGDQSLVTIEGKTTPVEPKSYPMPSTTIDV